MLIITLPLEPAEPSALLDCVCSVDGVTVERHVCTTLPLLPTPDRQTEVVALVPLRALSWHQVRLPAGSLRRTLRGQHSARLRAILDGLLEDQLLDEPAALHLALQPQAQVGPPQWVAACDSAWLRAALAALTQAGYHVTRIVPESSPPDLADVLSVTGEPDQPWIAGLLSPPGIAGATQDAVALPDAGSATQLVSCPLSAAAVRLLAPDAPVLAEPAVAELAEQLLNRPVTLRQRGQRLLQAAQSSWDLAQFDFVGTRRAPGLIALGQAVQGWLRAPQWRAARWALALLVLVQLVGLNAWAWRQHNLLQTQRQAIRSVLTQTFPKIPVVVDAPLQMVREVAALQRATGNDATDLPSILATFSALAPVGYTLNAIDYAAPEVRLSGSPMTVSDQQRVTDGLVTADLTVALQGDVWVIRPKAAP